MTSNRAKWMSQFFFGQNPKELARADGAQAGSSNTPQRILLRANTAFDTIWPRRIGSTRVKVMSPAASPPPRRTAGIDRGPGPSGKRPLAVRYMEAVPA